MSSNLALQLKDKDFTLGKKRLEHLKLVTS